MWLPGTSSLLRWRIRRLRRKGVTPERLVEAAATYVRFRARDPNGWIIWGNMLIHDGRLEDAERVLREGLNRHPRVDPLLGCLLARSLRMQSRLEEARAVLSEQVRDFPSSRLPRLEIAEVALVAKQWEDARARLNETLDRTPSTDARGMLEAARLLALIPQERGRAISILKESVGALPDDPVSQLELGAMLEVEGDEDARLHLQEAEARWEGPGSFSETLEHARRVLRGPGVDINDADRDSSVN